MNFQAFGFDDDDDYEDLDDGGDDGWASNPPFLSLVSLPSSVCSWLVVVSEGAIY